MSGRRTQRKFLQRIERIARRANHLTPVISRCPAPFAKIFLFFRTPNQSYVIRRPASLEGRFAIVTDARRDAVDAEAPITNGAEADGKIVWSWHPDAGVKFAKASFRGRRWQKSPVAGESTYKP
jgi:hypothetical protein